MAALSDAEADTGIDHVFSAAKGSTGAEHNIFIRSIEGADSGGVGSPVIAISGSKVPFFIRIKVQWMEGGQSSGTGTDAVDPVVYGCYAAAQALQLGYIDCIIVSCASGYMVDGLSAHTDIILLNGNVVGFVIVSAAHGKALPIDDGGAGLSVFGSGVGGAVHTLEVPGQLYGKSAVAIIADLLYDTDIAFAG